METTAALAERLEIVPYTASQQSRWDQMVMNSRNGNFLHLRNYMGYHAERFAECSVLVLRKGTPVAIFPANREDERVVSHAGLTYGGLIYGAGLYAAEVLSIFERLAAWYRADGARSIIYKSIPHVLHRMPAEEDLYALFRMNAKLVRRDLSSVIYMDNRPKFTLLRRKRLAKAQSLQVAVREGTFFAEFHAILTEVLAAHGAKPVHSVAEMELLRSRFPEQIRLFGAFGPDGQLLAGAIVYDFGRVVHTQYCGASLAGRAVGALDMVFAHLLVTEFADRRCFSFGISTEMEGRYLNEGLIHQKEGFGARGLAHDFYQWDL